MGDWTDSTGWHMELWSMLILSGQLVLLMICVKIYQCMVVGCCRADAEKKDEGKVYEHGDLFKERMLTQFLPIVLIYTIGLDLILNIAIFIIAKICTCGGVKKTGPSEKEGLLGAEGVT